ncbi:MFS general substrate transporter [Apiospora phragmitis]|uniref:MFS general substrate transporter n=1 Tax=Apiospora phragmitis TaxID=2905665 RepID=A0ABR1UZP7_9PEZI
MESAGSLRQPSDGKERTGFDTTLPEPSDKGRTPSSSGASLPAPAARASTSAWDSASTIATFVVFGVLLVLYVLQQYFAIGTSPERRLFPGHLLRDRTQVLLCVVTAAGTTSLFVVVYYIPIYFQVTLMAAVRLLPFVVIAIAVDLVSGTFLHFLQVYMALYLLASLFIVVGGGPLVVFLDPATSTATIYGLTVLLAVGAGLSMTMGYTIATLTLEARHVAAGLNLQNVAQLGGQVIALGVAGQIYQSTGLRNLNAALAGQGVSSEEIRGAMAGTQSALFDRLEEGPLRERAIVAITDAMQMTMVLVPVSGAVLVLAALCMKRERLFADAVVVGA